MEAAIKWVKEQADLMDGWCFCGGEGADCEAEKFVKKIQADALRGVQETAAKRFLNASGSMESAGHDDFLFAEGSAVAYNSMKNYLDRRIKKLESQ